MCTTEVCLMSLLCYFLLSLLVLTLCFAVIKQLLFCIWTFSLQYLYNHIYKLVAAFASFWGCSSWVTRDSSVCTICWSTCLVELSPGVYVHLSCLCTYILLWIDSTFILFMLSFHKKNAKKKKLWSVKCIEISTWSSMSAPVTTGKENTIFPSFLSHVIREA